jgi:hypothetical protein
LNDSDRRIARTAENIIFLPGKPALTLLDFDTKGMPPHVAEHIDEGGGFEAALLAVLPALASAARLVRASTSAGLYREDTGESLPGSNGMHALALIADGTDNPRFLGTLHERCWLAGFGWYTIGAAGQLLDRSIIDRVVASPERLVFEGPPVLTPPLRQNAEARRPIVTEGGALDTIATCPPLTVVEKAKLADLHQRAAAQLESEAATKRAVFITVRAERLVKRAGMSAAEARFVAERQTRGVLLPDIVLPFDDPELDGTKVAHVLADPERFVSETLADPIEGISYGRGKAKVMQRADGSLWVHSFAHGRTVYELKQDFIGAKRTLQKAAAEDADKLFVELVLSTELDAAEQDKPRELAISKSGTRKRVLDSMVKKARGEVVSRRQAEERDRRRALDPRFTTNVPPADSEWLPVMAMLSAALTAPNVEPPMRDAEGDIVQVFEKHSSTLHSLVSKLANRDDEDEIP